MDVFLIPTTTAERYELYYEAPDDDVVEMDAGAETVRPPAPKGFLHIGRVLNAIYMWGWRIITRMKLRFAEMLREAEEWRHRRHEERPEPVGFIAKGRRKVMGFIVERVAEQRLLWHLRKATQVCARIPTDMTESDADAIIRASLKKDADYHRKWLWIDATLLVLSAPLFVIPGPNVPGFYFGFQVVGHYLSWTGAKHGQLLAPWSFQPCQELAEVRAAFAMPPGPRQRRFHELASRLRLEHLSSFLEDVAAPPA